MGKPPPYISPEVLQRYLHNTCTDQEREAVEAWYSTLQGTPEYLNTLSEREQNQLQEETFRLIQKQLIPDQTRPRRLSTLRTLHPGWWIGVAASLLVMVGIWLVLPQKLPLTETAAPTSTAKQPVPPPAEVIRFVNDEPRMIMHQLPDGSTVWMHAESSITYPQAFEASRRMVTFAGEGFFDIKSDVKRPFMIQSGDMKVEVLGTRFNVKAPAKQAIYEVSVVSGSVAVSAPDSRASNQKVVLAPKQQALFEIQTRRLTTTILTEQKKEIYEPISITFEGTTLDQVAQQLSRRFDVRVLLNNPSMKSCRLTADFEEQSLPAILEMLCTSLDATYTMSGKTILIEGPACQ